MKIKEAHIVARLFEEGIGKETPKGSTTRVEIMKILDTSTTYVCIEGHKIVGFVSFSASKKRINVEFIYAAIPREGIGSALMSKVAKYALKKGIRQVRATMSAVDKAAVAFYTSLGFSKGKMINSFLYSVYAAPLTIISKAHGTEYCRSR